LVSWFQYNLKKEVKWKKVEELSLYSRSFAEIFLNSIKQELLTSEYFEFITASSNAYNSSISDKKLILDLHDRI
jgi:hypothetical protein